MESHLNLSTMSMAQVHPKKSIKVEEFTDWDFTTLPPNTKLYKVCMPEATNIKFYRNHKDSNKIRITFISINEEMKRRHKTIGLYERAIKIYRPMILDLKWTVFGDQRGRLFVFGRRGFDL